MSKLCAYLIMGIMLIVAPVIAMPVPSSTSLPEDGNQFQMHGSSLDEADIAVIIIGSIFGAVGIMMAYDDNPDNDSTSVPLIAIFFLALSFVSGN